MTFGDVYCESCGHLMSRHDQENPEHAECSNCNCRLGPAHDLLERIDELEAHCAQLAKERELWELTSKEVAAALHKSNEDRLRLAHKLAEALGDE